MCYKEDPWTNILCTNTIAAALLMVVVPAVCAIGIPFEIALVLSMAGMVWVNVCDDTRREWAMGFDLIKEWMRSTLRVLSGTN